METFAAIVISVLSLAFSVYFSTRNNKRADIKDIEERVKKDTLINTKLDSIASDTKDIRSDVSEMRKSINTHSEKIVAIEASAKQAHRRLDTFEQRLWGETSRKTAAIEAAEKGEKE